MKSNSYRFYSAIAAVVLAASVPWAHAGTGVRVFLQVWNPQAPDQEKTLTLVDRPNLITDSLQDAWVRARPQICEQLRLRMGLGRAAGGQTLSDITCLLDEHVTFNVVSANLNALHGNLAVSGYVEATSTTPTALGSWADPRFSVALTAKLDLVLDIQRDRDHTLRVSSAKFTLNNATLDSHNFNGDMLKFLADDLSPFFGGPNYKNMAENAINATSLDLAGKFNAALAPVNAQLVGPSDAVRVGASGTPDYVSVAFTPREVTPPNGGSMTGVLHWDPAQFSPRNGCGSFIIRATVQTGPAPMYPPGAVAPTREVGVFQAHPVSANSCAYTLTGLAPGWRNTLGAGVLDPPTAGAAVNSKDHGSYGLVSDGWDGVMVIPQPLADARNYTVHSYHFKTTDPRDIERTYQKPDYHPDTGSNPVDYSLQTTPARANASRVDAAMTRQNGGAISIDPHAMPTGSGPVMQPNAAANSRMQPRLKLVDGKAVIDSESIPSQPGH